MPFTKRFGFFKFGPDIGGSIFDENAQFSHQDRDTLDALLSALEAHDHSGGNAINDPTAAPGLVQAATGGSLKAGTTYHYKVTYVDEFGLETAPSDEAFVTTPAAVQVPSEPPTLEATSTGGTLESGVYYYALTVEAGAYETQLGPSVVGTLEPDRDAFIIHLPALPAGGDAFGIWRQGPDDPGFTKIGTTTAATILDDGSVPSDPCACDPENLPPEENRTNSTNTVTVTVPDVALVGEDGGPIKAWRIYRSTVSGSYNGKSLVAEVSDTVTEFGDDLVTEYLDTGAALMDGSPPSASRSLNPPPTVAGSTGVQVVQLVDSAGETWNLTVNTVTGQLRTVASGLANGAGPTYDVFLTDGTGQTWRVEVSTTGVLSTVAAAPAVGDRVFANGRGPFLSTSWQLSITTAGALETLGSSSSDMLTLTSPNGTIFQVSVDDDGSLVTTAI